MRNFKKLFLISAIFVIASIFILGVKVPNVQATTIDELQAQIQALLAQIAQLQQQLAEMQGQEPSWCHDFNVNLRIGDAGTEVGQLIKALRLEGFNYSYDDYSAPFDNIVASAVVGFQEKYASEVLAPWNLQHGTGFVGQTTRAKLNNLYGCGATTKGSLTVTKDSSTPISNIVIGGDNKVSLGTFRLSANNVENLDLDEITLTVLNGDYIDTLYLYEGDTLLGSTPGASKRTKYFNDGTLIIPANGYKRITVKADLYPVDGSVIKNGDMIQVAVGAVDTTGRTSGESVDSFTDVNANPMYIYKSRPYFSVNSATPSGHLFPSSRTLLAIFDVRADSGGDITFSPSSPIGVLNYLDIKANVAMADFSSSIVHFVIEDENENIIADMGIPSVFIANSTDNYFPIPFTFKNGVFTIPAGTTKQLYVYTDTTDFEDDDDFIQLWLSDKIGGDISWGIDGSGDYRNDDIIFRGDIYAGTLVNPNGGGGCINECSFSGQTRCIDVTHKKTCGNYDSDACLEWSSSEPCSLGQICQNGACKEEPTTTACTDSDGGKNYYLKGTTYGMSPYGPYVSPTGDYISSTDQCGGGPLSLLASEGQLTEYYCDGKYNKSTIFTCPSDCENGACKPGGFGLENIENQLANISKIISELMQAMK